MRQPGAAFEVAFFAGARRVTENMVRARRRASGRRAIRRRDAFERGVLSIADDGLLNNEMDVTVPGRNGDAGGPSADERGGSGAVRRRSRAAALREGLGAGVPGEDAPVPGDALRYVRNRRRHDDRRLLALGRSRGAQRREGPFHHGTRAAPRRVWPKTRTRAPRLTSARRTKDVGGVREARRSIRHRRLFPRL